MPKRSDPAIYNKSMPIEMQREYAYAAYMNTDNFMSASEKTGVPVAQIRAWAKSGGWEEEKREHYRKVHQKHMEIHNTSLAEKKANLANSVYGLLADLTARIVDDEDMSELDRAKTIEILTNVASTLSQNEKKEEKPLIPGISAENQQVFINLANSSNGDSLGDSDSVDVEIEEMLDSFDD